MILSLIDVLHLWLVHGRTENIQAPVDKHPSYNGDNCSPSAVRLFVWVNSNMMTQSDTNETELPLDLAEAFRRAGGMVERPQTLNEGFSAVTDRLNEAGVTVTLEDMYQSELTRHAVHVGETVKHVPCVMDALIVALLHDTDPVEIYSESPTGDETIHFHVTGDEVTVTPTSTVVSFGIGLEESTNPDLDSIRDKLNDPDTSIPTTCSVINAFPNSVAYEHWAEDVSEAAVMELDVETLFSLSQEAVRSHTTGRFPD